MASVPGYPVPAASSTTPSGQLRRFAAAYGPGGPRLSHSGRRLTGARARGNGRGLTNFCDWSCQELSGGARESETYASHSWCRCGEMAMADNQGLAEFDGRRRLPNELDLHLFVISENLRRTSPGGGWWFWYALESGR